MKRQEIPGSGFCWASDKNHHHIYLLRKDDTSYEFDGPRIEDRKMFPRKLSELRREITGFFTYPSTILALKRDIKRMIDVSSNEDIQLVYAILTKVEKHDDRS